MCHAILRVTFKGEFAGKPELHQVDSDSALDQKLKELQEKPNVEKVGIFKRQYDEVLTQRWERVVYVPQTTTAATGEGGV